MYLLPLEPPSHLSPHPTLLGWYRALVLVPWVIQQMPIGCLFYVWWLSFHVTLSIYPNHITFNSHGPSWLMVFFFLTCFWWPWQFILRCNSHVFCRLSQSWFWSDAFLMFKNRVTGFGEKDYRSRVPFSSHHIKGTNCHHDLLLILTWVIWLKWILSGFYVLKLFFFTPPFHIVVSRRKSLSAAHT